MKENKSHTLQNPTSAIEVKSFDTSSKIAMIMLITYLLTCFTASYYFVTYTYILSCLLWIPTVAAICFYIHKGIYLQRRLYIFCILFILWIILSCWINGDLFINDLNNKTYLISRCIMCFIALPCVYIFNDHENRRFFDIFMCIMVILIAAFLWLSFLGILRGENISLFNSELSFGATYTYTDRMMLKFFNMHYYTTAYLALIGFFVTFYLAVSHWSKKRCPAFLILMGTFIIAILITYSRTAFFTLLIGLLIALMIMLKEFNIGTAARITILAVTAVSGIIITILAMNYIYQYFNSIRDIWYGISTLSSRTVIWGSILDIAREQPFSMLHGLSITEGMTVMNTYIDLPRDISHMHNGYLQTLVYFGLPAMAAIIAFCVYILIGSYRILFDRTSDNRYPVQIKLMVIIPICYMIMNCFESLITSNAQYTDIFNFILALFSGYIIEYAYPKDFKKNDDKNP